MISSWKVLNFLNSELYYLHTVWLFNGILIFWTVGSSGYLHSWWRVTDRQWLTTIGYCPYGLNIMVHRLWNIEYRYYKSQYRFDHTVWSIRFGCFKNFRVKIRWESQVKFIRFSENVTKVGSTIFGIIMTRDRRNEVPDLWFRMIVNGWFRDKRVRKGLEWRSETKIESNRWFRRRWQQFRFR